MKTAINFLLSSIILVLSINAFAAFQEESRRYLAPLDYIIKLENLFPNRNWKLVYESYTNSDYELEQCSNFDTSTYQPTAKKSSFGTNFSGTGQPSSPYPGPSFLNSYFFCAENYIKTDVSVIDEALKLLYYSLNKVDGENPTPEQLDLAKEILETYLPDNFINHLLKSAKDVADKKVFSDVFSQQHRYMIMELDNINYINDIILHNIERVLGPEPVVTSFGYVQSNHEIVEWVKLNLTYLRGTETTTYYDTATYETVTTNSHTIKSFLKSVLLLLLTREEFLTY